MMDLRLIVKGASCGSTCMSTCLRQALPVYRVSILTTTIAARSSPPPRQSEHQGEPTTTEQMTTMSACSHPEAIHTRWGAPIRSERQGYLGRGVRDADHSERKGPFDWNYCKVYLTGADVFWLAEQSGRSASDHVPHLHLENANLNEAYLEGAQPGASGRRPPARSTFGTRLSPPNPLGAYLVARGALRASRRESGTSGARLPYSGSTGPRYPQRYVAR